MRYKETIWYKMYLFYVIIIVIYIADINQRKPHDKYRRKRP